MSNKFEVVRKGYEPSAVDDYVRRTDEYIDRLESEVKNHKLAANDAMNALQAYREKEAAINNAIINAQISADTILLNAKNAADSIMKNAKVQAERAGIEFDKRIEDIKRSITPQRQMLQNFKYEYNAMISKYLRTIQDEDFATVNEGISALEEYIAGLQPGK